MPASARLLATATLATFGLGAAWGLAIHRPALGPAPNGTATQMPAGPSREPSRTDPEPVASRGATRAEAPPPAHAVQAFSRTEPVPESVASFDVPPRCPGGLRLSATVHHPERPERSLALLRTSGSERGALYRRGMRVLGYRVAEIGPRGVLMRSDAERCWVPMTGDVPGAARTKLGFSAAMLDRGVNRVGRGRYRVDRTLLTLAGGSFGALESATGLQVVQRRGQGLGLKLDRVPVAGFLYRLGLRPGDILTSVNGQSLATNHGKRQLRSALLAGRGLKLELERRNHPRTIYVRTR
jgi:hypothetical protein